MKKLRFTVAAFSIAALMGIILFGGRVEARDGGEQSFQGSIEVKRGVDYAELAKILPREAQKLIIRQYPEVVIRSIRLQEENGYLVYEVLLLDNNRALDVKVDAGNGKILKIDGDAENVRDEKEGESFNAGGNPYTASTAVKNSPESALYNLAKVSMQYAIASAVKKVSGKIVKTELDNENGYLVYSIEIAAKGGNIKDVKVDAGNGKVLFVGNNPDEDGQQYENNGEEDNSGEGKDREDKEDREDRD